MRLLHVDTLEFSRFTPSSAPRYAVASHRWGVNEAAYKDVLKRRNVDTEGYRKVEAFCAFVKVWDPSIQWLWIDTCCIDKKSSAEESEAINSMYQYYSRAEVCIALLADVASLEAYADNEEMLMEAFENSIWFTRGWTLQELLAPTTVVFTTCAWEVIGYKTQAAPNGEATTYGPEYGRFLNDSIARITSIPEYILWDFPQSRALSVQERMNWMSRRTTTRVEDMAYCLLGIFGVHMALIYGEGEGAMARLEEEVRKRENMSVSGSVFGGGDDSKSVAAPSVLGGGFRRVESPPPMPPLPPTRAMTMQSEMGQSDPKKELKQEYKDAKRQLKAGQRSASNGGTVVDGATVRADSAPQLPGRAPPAVPGMSDRVSAWMDQTEDPTPSVADEDDYGDGDDTETLVSWNTAPSEADTNFSGHAYNRPQFSPPIEHGAFHSGTVQDLTDALPPPPPYPGTLPRANTSSSQGDGPSMGIRRAQTYNPSTIGSSHGGRPDLKSKILLRRLEAERAKRAKIEGSSNGDPAAFAPPTRSQTFAGPDDLESLAPDDSASTIGGPAGRSGSQGHQSAGGRGAALLRRLTEERERARLGSGGGGGVGSSVGGSSSPSVVSRSQTLVGGPLDVLSTIGSEVGNTRKALRQMLKDERSALRQARKGKK